MINDLRVIGVVLRSGAQLAGNQAFTDDLWLALLRFCVAYPEYCALLLYIDHP